MLNANYDTPHTQTSLLTTKWSNLWHLGLIYGCAQHCS